MRTIGLFVAALLVTACISEVKPYLKPVETDIPTRIAEQQKWVDQDISLKVVTFEDAKPVRKKLDEIKMKYEQLQSAGRLTANDSKAINRMLDETSDRIFRFDKRKQKNLLSH